MKRNLKSESTPVATASTSEELQTNVTPSQEAIAAVAFSYWQERARRGGSAEEDWLRAEQELKGKATGATNASEAISACSNSRTEASEG